MKLLKFLLIAFLVVYLAPTLAAAAWWALQDRPATWSEARWNSSGILPKAKDDPRAAIYILSAATGGMKGAVASHSWIVLKRAGASAYERYDKVGWGNPIRRNGYAADAFWYSNHPRIVRAITGPEAERLIPAVEKAIETYPFAKPGGYRLYPGPNSNTFVALVLRSVPALGAVLPPDAVGRDYPADGRLVSIDEDGRDVHASLWGLAGIAFGARSGIELHLLGLVAGLDFTEPGIKIPAFGTVPLF